ncbi:hypothetical protein BH24ACT5_BH24ACT5_06940 [soil metagenome]
MRSSDSPREVAKLACDERWRTSTCDPFVAASADWREVLLARAQTHESFKHAPLTEPGPQYVVMADVAACYEYIDHEILEQELISRTADPFLTRAIIAFLQGVVGRQFGLPQNRTASHRLAELVLGIPERVLLRKGIDAWRYSDDFRLGAASPAEAHLALELLEQAVRSVGLTLNDEKSSIRPWLSYQEWTNAISDRTAEVEDEISFEFGQFDYDGNLVEIDQAGAMVGGAERLLELWRADVQERRNQYGPEAVVGRQMVSKALGVLRAARSTTGLSFCETVVAQEPALTLQVGRYMRQLMGTDLDLERAVDATLNSLFASDVYVGRWQALWLMYPLERSQGLTPVQIQWLDHLAMSPNYTGASAISVLARHGEIEVDRLLSGFDLLPVGSRPLLVDAVARRRSEVSGSRLRALLAEDRFLRWVFDAVVGEDDDDHLV